MIKLLDKIHNRKDFDCGNIQLNNYLKKQAGQDIKRKLSVCFVLSDCQNNIIKGYYTLSNSSIPLNNFSDRIRKKLPQSYKTIPTTLLGQLAVDKRYQNSFWLLAVGFWLLAFGYWLLAFGYWLLAIGC